jgi:hypothetical protein
LLEQFEALQEPERSEVLAELLRRAPLAEHNLPTDDDLVTAADHLFSELDRFEQAR